MGRAKYIIVFVIFPWVRSWYMNALLLLCHVFYMIPDGDALRKPHYAMERKKEMRLSGNIAKELPDFLHWDMVLPILRSLFRVEIRTGQIPCTV